MRGWLSASRDGEWGFYFLCCWRCLCCFVRFKTLKDTLTFKTGLLDQKVNILGYSSYSFIKEKCRSNRVLRNWKLLRFNDFNLGYKEQSRNLKFLNKQRISSCLRPKLWDRLSHVWKSLYEFRFKRRTLKLLLWMEFWKCTKLNDVL